MSPAMKPTATAPRRLPLPETSLSSEWSAPPSRWHIRRWCSTPFLADSFEQFANQLEPLEGEAVWQQVQCIIRDTMRSHSRVIYNGNNYSEQWVMEAQRRGLPILRTSVEAFATLTEQKNIELFDHHHIFSPKETAARYEIQLENYIHVLQIEASTMLEIAKRQIIPSVIGYSGKLAESLHRLEQCGLHPQRLENHLPMVSDSTESVMA